MLLAGFNIIIGFEALFKHDLAQAEISGLVVIVMYLLERDRQSYQNGET